MSYAEITELVRTASVTVIFAFLWWTERMDRKAAEKRERDVLRDVAVGNDLKSPET